MRVLVFFLGIMAVLLSSSFNHAEEAGEGRISGVLMTRDGEVLENGLAVFFMDSLGPPPDMSRYMRIPDKVVHADREGKFAASLSQGKYYIGGLSHSTQKWNGPPREGDIFFISRDRDGKPETYEVIAGKGLDAGLIIEQAQQTKPGHSPGITAISGTVYTKQGEPAEDVVVFAYRASSGYHGLAFVSGYTGEEGKYMLRTHMGGTYDLTVMGEFGSVFPADGLIITDDGNDGSGGIKTVTGQVNDGVDIRLE